MKRSVRYSRGRVQYVGRIDRASFAAWCQSPDGRSVLDPIVPTMRFALFGRTRAARRSVWRELTQAVRSESVVAALAREVDSYLASLDTLAYQPDLPRVGVQLHRLVAVPRLFANATIGRRLDALLETQPAFATVNGRQLLRDWFIVALIDGIETAVAEARPSPTRPLSAGEDWIVVGVNHQFEWRVPFRGPGWPGHYYLLELTRMPVTRAIRRAAAEAIVQMETSLPSLSGAHRSEILRRAASSFGQTFARA